MMLNAITQNEKTRSIAFLNWAHGLDHFVLGIYPTIVIGLEVVFRRSYSELIALSTAMFVAFGVFSLPAGWLADRWSRRTMMAAFFIGCGVSLAAAAFAPNLIVLALALFALGVFAAIYHPVGTAMLIELSQARGRTLAFNGVCGNLGVALASAITAALASSLGWRGAFLAPAMLAVATGIFYLLSVADDHSKTGTRKSVPDVVLPRPAALAFFLLYVVISFAGGLTFNTIVIALPKIVEEKVGGGINLMAVGGLATLVFLCGAAAQLVVGRLVERFPAHLLFGAIVALQFAGVLWAAQARGIILIPALALVMVGIYGQITVGDIVIARYTADAWRGRVYAVRFFLTFISSAVAVSLIALLHDRGGFDLVLAALVVASGAFLAAVLSLVAVVSSVETRRKVIPAE
jgi:MFS family permease